MNPVTIRTLQADDAAALLRFELDNRHWFERHIERRDAGFYSLEGVTQHIGMYLSGLANGTWHPLIIADADGQIIGRANLKDIDLSTRSGEIGYRIAEQRCGQGLATLAVNRLIDEARTTWGLARLVADVYVKNIGSAKVLQRAGFSIEQVSRHAHGEDRYLFARSI